MAGATGARLARGGDSMFYVSAGSVPHKRHTQHREPDGGLYSEELFGVEGFVGRSSLLYHLVPPTRTHRIEAGDGDLGSRRPTTASIAIGWSRPAALTAARRRPLGPDPAVLQRRRDDGRLPARRADGRRMPSTATAKATRCSSSTPARASSRPSSATCATGRATTSSCRSARPGG